jgi:nicotinate-nucleotide--dimethylbenzimidazole phosphoribosyltransferase
MTQSPMNDNSPTVISASPSGAFGPDARQALRRIIDARRDVRRRFLTTAVPDEVLDRVLEAAHKAPSVGLSQPWDFLILTDPAVRARVGEHVEEERRRFAASLPASRSRAFSDLKVEAIREAPLNLVVTSTLERGGAHVLGRYTQPEMAHYSTCLAIENLWLTARAHDDSWASESRHADCLSLRRVRRRIRPGTRAGIARLGQGSTLELGGPQRKMGAPDDAPF